MSYKFNPFTATFDQAPASDNWKDPVSTLANLPMSGNTAGDVRITEDTGIAYFWDGADWVALFENKVENSSLGVPGGVATLNGAGKLTATQVPAIAITDTFVVGSQAAMLALSSAETGDVAIRTDLNKSFILQGTSYSTLSDWQELLSPIAPVSSVNGQTGSVVLTTSDIAEGTNLYYTSSRFNSAFSAKSTTDLAEGSNLYYTAARFNTAFSAKSTTDLSEGSNLYFTSARAKSAAVADSITDGITDVAPSQNAVFDALALKANDATVVKSVNSVSPVSNNVTLTTTNIAEGTNLYYTSARFNTAFAAKSTTDLAEGTNLYYTTARFDTAFATKTTTNLTEGTNLYYTTARFDTAFAGKTTTNLTEGTNLYFTTARAKAAAVADAIVDAVTDVAPSQNAVFDALALKVDKVTGDIAPTSFSLANNQSAAANVTGLAFANATVRAAEVQYSVFINATPSYYEAGRISLLQKASSWEIVQTRIGDDSQVTFTVTTAGQVQYTSANYPAFTSGTMKFRATTVPV